MRERNVWATGGSQLEDTLQERQGSVLTNQCLGKKQMLGEELVNTFFPRIAMNL